MPDKFERFTERARQVLILAHEEARRFNHTYIGTEHLLLGLVREGDGVAARTLQGMGIELPRVRGAVEHIIARGDSMVVGEIGLTPRAKKAIELAVDEARRLGHHDIGTEHLLLGLVRESEGIAAGVLQSLGVNLGALRERVLAAIGATEPEPPDGVRTADQVRNLQMLLSMLTDALERHIDLRVDPETRRLAGDLHALLGQWLERQGDLEGD